jgi:hypothetical protein
MLYDIEELFKLTGYLESSAKKSPQTDTFLQRLSSSTMYEKKNRYWH